MAMLAWGVIAGVVVVLAAWFAPPIHPILLALTGMLPFALLPLSAAIVIGGLTWRPAVLTAASVVAISTLMLSSTAMIGGSCVAFDADRVARGRVGARQGAVDDVGSVGPSGSDTRNGGVDDRASDHDRGSSIVIYQANVLWADHGGDPLLYLNDIALANPDVIGLQEAGPEFVSVFESDEMLDRYPFRLGTSKTRLYSRLPLIEDRSAAGDAIGFYVSALLEGPTGPMEVTVVHTRAPTTVSSMQRWEEHFKRIRNSVERSEPRIILGDFNASSSHRPFRQLMGEGFTDAHDRVGCGLGSTWPIAHVAKFPVPIMRLDHVLYNDAFEAVSMRTGRAIDEPLGSDHHPLVVELRPR